MGDLIPDLQQIRDEYERGQLRPKDIAVGLKTPPVITSPEVSRFRGSKLGLGLITTSIVLALAGAAYVYSSRTVKHATASGAAAMSANPTAYDAYMRGMVKVGSENPADDQAAIDLFERGTAADPHFASAYAELARAYSIKVRFFAPVAEKKQLNEEAEVDVEKALALDPNLAEGYFARGLILWTPYKRFPHEQAVQAYKRAIELNPNLGEAHHQLGFVYLHIGLLDKGWQEIQKALAIDPGNSLARYRLGVIDMCRGKYDEAFQIFNTTPLEKSPSLLASYTSTALFRLGRNDEASAIVAQFFKDYPNDEGGLVTSVRGPGGGYRLSRPSGELRIADIILAVDEPIAATRCKTGSAKGCTKTGARCVTHDLWEELGQQIHVFLSSVSLADVVEKRVLGRAKPCNDHADADRSETVAAE